MNDIHLGRNKMICDFFFFFLNVATPAIFTYSSSFLFDKTPS